MFTRFTPLWRAVAELCEEKKRVLFSASNETQISEGLEGLEGLESID